MPSEVGYEQGYPVPSRLGDLGERRELPSGVRDEANKTNTFWRILKVIECTCVNALSSSVFHVALRVRARPTSGGNCHLPQRRMAPADVSIKPMYLQCISTVDNGIRMCNEVSKCQLLQRHAFWQTNHAEELNPVVLRQRFTTNPLQHWND